MSVFSDAALEKKLQEMNTSQPSIQTLSLWIIHHRKHHRNIVQIWYKELKKIKPNRKLTFMHLANDVIQNSKKKGPEFSKEFVTVLSKAFAHVNLSVADEKVKRGLNRIIDVWEDRSVYDSNVINDLRSKMGAKQPISKSPVEKMKKEAVPDKGKKRKQKTPDANLAPKKKPVSEEEIFSSPKADPPEPEVLVKALMDLEENAPSTDAVVREKIAKLPPEVSDISLLDKIQDRDAAKKLSLAVEEACSLLTDYNNRLTEELDGRKHVSKILNDFTHYMREKVSQGERKIEEYKEKLKRISQVRSELKSHLQNLPDLTLLPSVTGGLAPLPSAGDLFQ